MKQIVFITLFASLLCSCSTIPQEAGADSSPHGEAIMIVLTTQKEVIRRVDQGDWWHDVKTRGWEVKRPFYPGRIDSTHMFVVLYKIDGKVVAAWNVDTKKKEASPSEAL